MGVKVVFNNINKTASRICDNKRVGLFVAETCARYMDPYVPMDTGMLAQNYITRPFEVEYVSPYAHRQYTGAYFNFSKEKHPLATAYWDKAMMQAKSKQIAREITAFMKRS